MVLNSFSMNFLSLLNVLTMHSSTILMNGNHLGHVKIFDLLFGEMIHELNGNNPQDEKFHSLVIAKMTKISLHENLSDFLLG